MHLNAVLCTLARNTYLGDEDIRIVWQLSFPSGFSTPSTHRLPSTRQSQTKCKHFGFIRCMNAAFTQSRDTREFWRRVGGRNNNPQHLWYLLAMSVEFVCKNNNVLISLSAFFLISISVNMCAKYHVLLSNSAVGWCRASMFRIFGKEWRWQRKKEQTNAERSFIVSSLQSC